MVGVFRWWYGNGWLMNAKRAWHGVLRTADFFSAGLLLRTLFNPFKQISAGKVDGPLPVQLSAWADRLFSRIMGGCIRSLTIIFGLVAIILRIVWALITIILWSALPFVPVLGLILWLSGVSL